MMKIFKMYIIPTMVLLLFVGIMTSGGIAKKPFGKSDDVILYIDSLKKDVANENWQQAKMDITQVKSSWSIVEKRVQFSVERNAMTAIDVSISRIEGAISAQDKTAAIIELSQITRCWDDLEQ